MIDSYYVVGHDGIGQFKVYGGGQPMGGENGKGNREIDKRGLTEYRL